MNTYKNNILALLLGLLPCLCAAAENPITRVVINRPAGWSEYNSGQVVKFSAMAFDANGYEVPCKSGWEWTFQNPMMVGGSHGTDVINQINKDTGLMTMGAEDGSGQVRAFCKDQPNVKARQLVTNSGFPASAKDSLATQQPMEPKTWEAPATDDGMRDAVADTSTSTSAAAADPGVNAGLIALGVGVAAAGAVAIGSALSDYSSDTGGGSCYLRSCLRSSISGSCSCQEFNSEELCQFNETGPGGQCSTGDGFTTALCPDGYSCVNGTCRADC